MSRPYERRRLAQTFLAILLVCSAGKYSFAQGVGNDDSPTGSGAEQGHDIFQSLDDSPASALDIGLLRLQQLVSSYLLANKPQIFTRRRFHYFDVTFSRESRKILISGAYRSNAVTSDELVAECKDDMDVVLAALRLDVPATELLGTESDRSALSCATVNSMFANRSMPGVLPNVCHSVGIWIRVESDDGKSNVRCRRRFDDNETEVIKSN